MALQFFLFSLLVLNNCWRSESDCTFASSWFREYYDIGWATCDSSTQYITWLLWKRTSFPENKRAILSQGKCCPMAFYGNTSSTCQIANLRVGLAEWVYIAFHVTCPSGWELTWHLRTKLHKLGLIISPNISQMKNCTDLNLDEGPCILTSFPSQILDLMYSVHE